MTKRRSKKPRTEADTLRIFLNRGYRLITPDCSGCPIIREYDGRKYCIYGLVDGCTKCRYDRHINEAINDYKEASYWIDLYDETVRNALIENEIRGPGKG